MEDLCLTDLISVKSPDVLSLQHLTSSNAGRIRKLVSQFPDVFNSMGSTHIFKYNISLKDIQLDRLPHYHFLLPKMNMLQRQIDVMLDKGIICPSVLPYSCPIFIVAKGNSDFRPVVNYCELNQKINVESVSHPDLQSACDWFRGAMVFTSLDLNSPYHQIPLKKSSHHLTAFATN